LLGGLVSAAAAVDVQVVAVVPGRSAAIVIDGGNPVTIEIGETIDSVKLLRAGRSEVDVSIDGLAVTLPLARATGTKATRPSSSITLTADARDHFVTNGIVNGRAVRFLVDTGASLTTLSRGEAQRIGLQFRDGQPTAASTANGVVRGWQIWLDTVVIGSVTVRNVKAMVIDTDALDVSLLGMSYLSQFDLQRQGTTLVLRRR